MWQRKVFLFQRITAGALLGLLALPARATAQDRDPVAILRGIQLDTIAGEITVFHSRGYEERARDMQRLYEGAIAFYEERLGEDFDVALAVLNEPDWTAFEIPGTGPLRPPQAVIPYGWPHTDFYGYISGSLAVVVLPAESDRGVLADAAREFGLQDQVGRFVDVGGFHEFGHYMIEQYMYSHLPPCPAPACQRYGRYRGPSLRWLDEFLATYIGHGYLWHTEGFDSDPYRLSIFDGHTPAYRSLREFEEQYARFATAPDGMINMGWYQAHFNEQARVMFARHGPGLIERVKAELPWDRYHSWTTDEILAALEAIAPGFVAWAEQFTGAGVPDASSDTHVPPLTATPQDH
jgi:hypothetical protein